MEKITGAALNRALLARQLLLAREHRDVLETVEHLGGMQAQVPNAPYVGLWSRLAEFDPQRVSQLLTDRELVRISAMRGTIHLLSAADALSFRPLCQVVNDRGPYGHSVYRRALAGIDPAEFRARAAALLEWAPMSNAELGAALLEVYPGYDPSTLAWAVRDGLPLVQVPPRGLWGQSRQATSTTVEHWLGRPLDPAPSADAMVLRYLAGFGPASVRDAQAWSGLTRLAEVFERLRPRLRVLADAVSGRELFDLPDAPRPAEDTPAPVRFLPEYDNVVFGLDDRSRIISAEDQIGLGKQNRYLAAFLVDGRVRGSWKLTRGKGGPDLTVTPFTPLSRSEQQQVDAEADALLAFHATARPLPVRTVTERGHAGTGG
ncbi:winged helix DNA-binding domain-containing protein [Streptacidiphilus sp. EB129]|uniref:winged helix DNA-binding domain-containing protein n=1 Tax=Streptacidiphilus sp. EB129 TaxID=3156262 RepID=UPI003511E2C6